MDTTQPESTPPVAHGSETLLSFVGDVVRPYRGTLLVVLAAMLVETAMSLAAPWPLKVVIDSVVHSHPLPGWMAWVHHLPGGESRLGLSVWCAVSVVAIALVGGIASYIDNYYTETVGQWVANDLRARVYKHLERLSLSYYDTHPTGAMLSTITADVATVQGFASSAYSRSCSR